MLNHDLDRWILKWQQFNITFNHIEGKTNIVADAFSRLKTLNLYDIHQEVDSVLSVGTAEDALEASLKKYKTQV